MSVLTRNVEVKPAVSIADVVPAVVRASRQTALIAALYRSRGIRVEGGPSGMPVRLPKTVQQEAEKYFRGYFDGHPHALTRPCTESLGSLVRVTAPAGIRGTEVFGRAVDGRTDLGAGYGGAASIAVLGREGSVVPSEPPDVGTEFYLVLVASPTMAPRVAKLLEDDGVPSVPMRLLDWIHKLWVPMAEGLYQSRGKDLAFFEMLASTMAWDNRRKFQHVLSAGARIRSIRGSPVLAATHVLLGAAPEPLFVVAVQWELVHLIALVAKCTEGKIWAWPLDGDAKEKDKPNKKGGEKARLASRDASPGATLATSNQQASVISNRARTKDDFVTADDNVFIATGVSPSGFLNSVQFTYDCSTVTTETLFLSKKPRSHRLLKETLDLEEYVFELADRKYCWRQVLKHFK